LASLDNEVGTRKPGIVWLPRYRFYTILVFTGLALFVPVLDLLRYTLKGDFWWVWNSGRWMAQHHRVLLSNPATWNGRALAGKPWVNLEWGWQWFIYAINPHLHPLNYIVLLFIAEILMLAAFLWALRAVAPYASPEAGAALYAVYSVLIFPFTVRLRAELFSYVAFPFLLGVLWRGRRDARWFWALPALTLVWANVHGSWLMIPVLSGLQLLETVWRRQWRRAAVMGAAGIAAPVATAVLFTPEHLRVVTYAWWLDHNHYISGFIQEWQSINFHQTTYLILGVVIFAAWLWRARSQVRYPLLLDVWFIGVTLAFFDEIRMITYFGVVFALWVGYGVGQHRIADADGRLGGPEGVRALRWAQGAGVMLALIASLGVLGRMQGRFLTPPVPRAVVAWAKDHPSRGVLAPIDVGGYLEAQGVANVFADGRSDFFLANGTRFQHYVTLIEGSPRPQRTAHMLHKSAVSLVIWPSHQLNPALGWFFLKYHWRRRLNVDGWAIYTGAS
jgi:hypothetical protein